MQLNTDETVDTNSDTQFYLAFCIAFMPPADAILHDRSVYL